MWDALLLFSEGYITHLTTHKVEYFRTQERKEKKRKKKREKKRKEAGWLRFPKKMQFGMPDVNFSLRHSKEE